jgi:hypothetical protein
MNIRELIKVNPVISRRMDSTGMKFQEIVSFRYYLAVAFRGKRKIGFASVDDSPSSNKDSD